MADDAGLSVAEARSRSGSVLLVVGTLAAGLALRKIALGLPPELVKHGGSVLWAAMVYWIVVALFPKWNAVRGSMFAVMVTSLIEVSQRLHFDRLDAFRRTSVGALLLGRVFSWTDVAVYAGAVLGAATLDATMRRGRRARARRPQRNQRHHKHH
jgi:hypothetical protein